jgi:hypothetical protein
MLHKKFFHHLPKEIAESHVKSVMIISALSKILGKADTFQAVLTYAFCSQAKILNAAIKREMLE